MAVAYTPGLKVTNRITHRTRRILPIAGDVRSKVGDHVEAEQVVAETFMPGNVTPVNMANILSVPPGEVPSCLTVKDGDKIEVGQVIGESKGFFGFFKADIKSKWAGEIESISKITGQMILRGDSIPVQVKAFLAGKIVEEVPDEGVVIEADVSYIQGIFGIGGEAYGTIAMACDSHTESLTPDKITDDMKGAIIIGGARMTGPSVKRAIEVGAAAVISGGIDDHDLKEILGYDLGVAITGTETIGTTVIITEGFGEISMAKRTFELLKSRVGESAAVNGATQIRAGVMRPEIIIPLSKDKLEVEQEEEHIEGILQEGVPVRVIRDPYFGKIGTVSGLPSEPQVLGSGSKARVLEVSLESSEVITVPRANVEIVGK